MATNERKVPVLRSDNSFVIEQEFDSIREKFEVEMRKMEEEMARFRSQMIASERDRHGTVSAMSSSSVASVSSGTRNSGMSNSKSTQVNNSSGSSNNNKAAMNVADRLATNEKLATSSTSHSTSLTSSSAVKSTSSSSSSRSSKTSSSIKSSSVRAAFDEQQGLLEEEERVGAERERNLAAQLNANLGGLASRDHLAAASPSLVNSPGAGWLNELNSPLIKESQDGSGAKVLRLRFDVTPYEPEQIFVKTIDNRLMIHAKREESSANTSMYREYNREFLLPEGTDPELIRSSLSADGVLTVEAPLPLPGSADSRPVSRAAESRA